jgi:hypothetical protein
MPAHTCRSAITALGLALLGCASGGAPAGESRSGESPSRRRGDVITREEIAHGQYASAYDVVRTLRPQWLVPRGSDTILSAPGEVQVRVDESWLGGIATLRSVASVGIEAIRWVDPVAAAGRWGGDFRNGAIVIVGLER